MKFASVTLESPRRLVASRPDLLPIGVLLIFCLFLFLASESVRYGDAVVYAADIRAGALTEPGHLIWRPLGRLVSFANPSLLTYSDVLWRLQILCLIASVLSVVSMYFLVRRSCGRSVAFFVSMFMAISNGFWVYSFSGCSYSLGVLFQIVALRYVVANKGNVITPSAACIAGVYGGLSAAAWGIELLAAPAIWLAVMIIPEKEKNAIGRKVKNTAGLLIGYALAFLIPLLVAFLFRANAPGETFTGGAGDASGKFWVWLSSARHGIPARLGVTQILRVVIGWPQSVLSISSTGQDLRLWHFKEAGFPWSFWLCSLLVFYAALVACGITLVRHVRH